MKFEWDAVKEKQNIFKHGIDFEIASNVFFDPYVYEDHDEAHSGYNIYGEWEDRYIAIGLVHDVLYVVYTIRDLNEEDVIRLISARVAEKDEKELYYKWRDGSI